MTYVWVFAAGLAVGAALMVTLHYLLGIDEQRHSLNEPDEHSV